MCPRTESISFTEEEKKILESLRGLIITTGKAEPDSGGREMKTNYTHQLPAEEITTRKSNGLAHDPFKDRI